MADRPSSKGTQDATGVLAALRSVVRGHLDANPGSAHERLIEQVEFQIVLEALLLTQGNLGRAAGLLGLSRPAVREKVRKYRIERVVQVSPADG
ncbi:MAG TPA: helix-turn-helix domain-containing protein [Planctomycetota bacterium]|nr:helix-turn-helix domain-containing protein [Planctomycetota bacterium]